MRFDIFKIIYGNILKYSYVSNVFCIIFVKYVSRCFPDNEIIGYTMKLCSWVLKK